jgi:hypothetical protein
MDRDAQLREALRRAADALAHACELGRNTEEQLAASRELSAQLRETTRRLESERRVREAAARDRRGGRQS